MSLHKLPNIPSWTLHSYKFREVCCDRLSPCGSACSLAALCPTAHGDRFLKCRQGGPATEALKVASKGLLDDADGAEAGLLPGRIPGSNSLMRPRSQQFPPGASTDSERCGPCLETSSLCDVCVAPAVEWCPFVARSRACVKSDFGVGAPERIVRPAEHCILWSQMACG